MAKLRSGILGNIRGKVAGVVGGQWKDINYLREYVLPANPNTASQQAQRTKMSDVVAFAKTLVGPVFNAYTDKFQKSMSGFNRFIKTNIAEFDGSPVWTNLVLTAGVLHAPGAVSAEYTTATGLTHIIYDDTLGNNGALGDKIFGAVYDTSTGLWYFPAAEVTRIDTPLVIASVPNGLTATNMEAYIWAIQKSGVIVTALSASVHAQCAAP